jgi:tRNA(Ile)-lysidine synthetase-like protein
MENLACDADFIDESAANLDLNGIVQWQALHKAVLFRVVRGMLERNFMEVPSLTYSFMRRLQCELAKFNGKPVILPLNDDVWFRLERSGLRLVRTVRLWSTQHWHWRKDKKLSLPEWSFSVVDGPGKGVEAFDEDALPEELVIRIPVEGDRIEPFGSRGKTKKLQDVFTEGKVLQEQREVWPVVLANDVIIWVPQLRRAQFAPVGNHTRTVYLKAVSL